MSVYQWSTTAGSNASADSNINWAEGQLPSTVNDSARSMMAALAALVRDQGGYATLGGSGNTFTLSLSQAMTSRVPSLIGFFATRSNTGAVTMNVDSLGAAPLRRVTGTDLVSDDIVNGAFYIISWDSTNSEWKIAGQSGLLPLTGGTMTGLLTLSGAPSSALHAATKTYVDAVASKTVTAGNGLTGGGTISSNPIISISSGGVGTTELASNAVTTIKITDANVTPAKIAQPFTASTAQTVTSGTTVDFTGIPSWVKRITLLISNTSFVFPGDTLYVLAGTGPSTFENTGYTSYGYTLNGGGASSSTTGFNFNMGTQFVFSGTLVISNITSNTWVATGQIGGSGVTNISILQSAKTTASTLASLRIGGVLGRAFASGTFNIFYE